MSTGLAVFFPPMPRFVRGLIFVALGLALSSCSVVAGIVSDDGAHTDESVRSTSLALPAAEPTESLTPTERHWASQMDRCVGVTEF
ncbi:MAG TPA: hypothetical protein PK826_14080, partial [Anaerolineae bacterium]|nr:hypothetical protein [Anaerolineae bacterium]